jgi:tRNA-splicing ligase RtcB
MSSKKTNYTVFQNRKSGNIIKAWVDGVPLEEQAKSQLMNIASMPFIHRHIAVMPDVHLGRGATVGSIIPTKKAIIPAACGVDIGCGMCAVKTTLTANDLPDNLKLMRTNIERTVPHGRTNNGGKNDRGAWHDVPHYVADAWADLEDAYKLIGEKHPKIMGRGGHGKTAEHLGSLGSGNHFVEVCLDQNNDVWIMLHSGSRGVGNRIGQYFINLAKKDMERWFINLPDKDLSYFPEGTEHFNDYTFAVKWAQDFARVNRELMMSAAINAIRNTHGIPFDFVADLQVVNCHHNYVDEEDHYGERVWVTRKGAVSARKGQWGIIPGSMGAKSFIVVGKGNPESFNSCSHGAGRKMSRTEAKKRFTLDQHKKATEGVECRKDKGVIDETPAAYKNIDDVMRAQSDLVDVRYTLKQVLCVKG